MKFKEHTVRKMSNDLQNLMNDLIRYRRKSKSLISEVLPTYKQSAENLLMYIAFRKNDHTKLQRRLGNHGLSRLARAESHILASIVQNRMILESLLGNEVGTKRYKAITIKKSEKLLEKRIEDLLGKKSGKRRLRIMVTLPSEAADSSDLIEQLVDKGMNVARINCAHDTKKEWTRMIENVRGVSQEKGVEIKVAMDLAGPKVRTGKMKPGPKVMKVSPVRNEYGRIQQQATFVLTRTEYLNSWKNSAIISSEDFEKIEDGDVFSMKDTSGKTRHIYVQEKTDSYIKATANHTVYIEPGTILSCNKCKVVIRDVPELDSFLMVHKGDFLDLYKNGIEGEQGSFDPKTNEGTKSSISCTEPEILKDLIIGQNIYFDDGKITAKVEEFDKEKVRLQIMNAKVSGSKLKADKGINVPSDKLSLKGLTEKDKEDLNFVAANADIINYSFVNSKEDVQELLHELKKRDTKEGLGVVLKIETQQAYNNIAEILLESMKTYPIGVMIARGDLAVETGWNHIGIIQKELLTLCAAAHIPVIWATQVLENLAKKGLPSRSEITDAVTSVKADCVMLNKGPYIANAVGLLDEILTIQQAYQFKNAPYSPKLERF